jgi:transposase
MKNLLLQIKKEVDLNYNTDNALNLDKIEAFKNDMHKF